MRKLKFYLIGLIPGLIIVFLILNQKGASCSGYLPNSRVIAESLTKPLTLSPTFEAEMKALNLTEDYIKDSIIAPGYIDFDKSQAQKTPCPFYYLTSSKENPTYAITYEKCKDDLKLLTLKKLK